MRRKYRKLIERELFGIRRVRDLKIGALGIISGTLVAAMIGFFDNIFGLMFGIIAQAMNEQAQAALDAEAAAA